MNDTVDLFDIVPGLCGDEFEHKLFESMLSEAFDLRDVKRAALDTISSVTGRPWWFAMRLIKTAMVSWEIVGGELAFRGVDAERLSVSAWLDAVLLICLRALDSTKVTMFMSQLEVPPAEELENSSPADMEMSADAFLALAH
jgi:hypothetical protein